jgi:hypothetical protein
MNREKEKEKRLHALAPQTSQLLIMSRRSSHHGIKKYRTLKVLILKKKGDVKRK